MTSDRLKLVVHGAGRMGQQVAAQAADQGFEVQALVSRAHPGDLGAIDWRPGLDALDQTPDVLIDFSLPAGTVAAARWCAKSGVPLVSGTTGLDEAQEALVTEVSKQIPVLHAANFSPGLNALAGALEHLGHWLPGIASAQLLDIHHVHKKDAPSGTALTLARSLDPIHVAIESERRGEVIGEHRVTLNLPGERLILTHEAQDRGVFALGALQAGHWLVRQKPGRYRAIDWLKGQGS